LWYAWHSHPAFFFLLLSVLLAAVPGPVRADSYLSPIGGFGGGQFTALCPAGQNLTGFDLRATDDVDAMRPVCVVSYGPTEISAPPPVADTGWYGGPSGRVVRLLCPPITPVVIGAYIHAEGVTVVVNNIHLYCGKAVASQTPPSLPSAVFDGPRYVPGPGLQRRVSLFGAGEPDSDWPPDRSTRKEIPLKACI